MRRHPRLAQLADRASRRLQSTAAHVACLAQRLRGRPIGDVHSYVSVTAGTGGAGGQPDVMVGAGGGAGGVVGQLVTRTPKGTA